MQAINQRQTVSVKPLTGATDEGTRAVVESILCHPAIAPSLTHDHRAPGYIQHPNVSYLGAYVDERLVGVFTVVESGFIEIDLHAAILPRALKQSRALGKACLAHVFRDPEVARVTAYITGGLESAANYCRKLGFRDEGVRRDAAMKDGRLVGVRILGMTRAEWEAAQ